MIKIEPGLKSKYTLILNKNGIPEKEYGYYLKWLRYYLDFCHKYNFNRSDFKSLSRFIEKPCSKQQSKGQQQQATNAIRLFYSSIKSDDFSEKNSMGEIKEHIQSYSKLKKIKVDSKKKVDTHTYNQSWQGAYQKLENEIKVRHYSPKTYKGWVRKFQTFIRSKDLKLLDSYDVKNFLSYLAVELDVSASSQNLAFNSLLFFYRHILGREFGKIDGVVRAKKRPYIPVVLSRNEVDSVIDNLNYPYNNTFAKNITH